MSHQEGWERLVAKWWGRLIPEISWRYRVMVDDLLDSTARVEYSLRSKVADVRFRSDVVPSDEVVCHEICHILTARLSNIADALLAKQSGDGGVGKWALEEAWEETNEDITRAFLRAYGEPQAPYLPPRVEEVKA